ncbi:MAG: hypothetical protein ABJG88_04040 [Litorimonas sp.]
MTVFGGLGTGDCVMAIFGMRIKRRRASYGSYHVDVDHTNSFFKRSDSKESIGLVRTLASGIIVSLICMLGYVTLHYIPAFVSPQKILNSTSVDTSPERLKNKGPIRRIFGPYIDAFSMQRTYLRKGQKIEAQFILPEGVQLELKILQCKPVLVMEVFRCDVISRKDITVTNETLGYRAFQFEDNGFYHFHHNVIYSEGASRDYAVVWSRL